MVETIVILAIILVFALGVWLEYLVTNSRHSKEILNMEMACESKNEAHLKQIDKIREMHNKEIEYINAQRNKVVGRLMVKVHRLKSYLSHPAIDFIINNIEVKEGGQISAIQIRNVFLTEHFEKTSKSFQFTTQEIGILIKYLFPQFEKKEIKGRTYYLNCGWKEDKPLANPKPTMREPQHGRAEFQGGENCE